MHKSIPDASSFISGNFIFMSSVFEKVRSDAATESEMLTVVKATNGIQ